MAVTANTNGQSNGIPVKQRELTNHHMDSSVWNDVDLRPDDIVITTYPKCGTTVGFCCLSSHPRGNFDS